LKSWNERPAISSVIATTTVYGPGGPGANGNWDFINSWDVSSYVDESNSSSPVTLVTVANGPSDLGTPIEFLGHDAVPIEGGGLNGFFDLPYERPRLELKVQTTASALFNSVCTNCHGGSAPQPLPCGPAVDVARLRAMIPNMLRGWPLPPGLVDTGCGVAGDEASADYVGCEEAVEPLVSYVWEDVCGN